MKKYYCIDCDKEISDSRHIRCRKCADKQHSKRMKAKNLKGKNSPSWKGGKPKCLDCGKKLTRRNYKRCSSCSKKKEFNGMFDVHRFGKSSPGWQGGISVKKYPIEFNDDLRDIIRTRDNHQCQNCDMVESEHLIVYGRILTVHHIDYDKQNCKKSNLITLCTSCNIRANYNRDYWTKKYQGQIMDKIKKLSDKDVDWLIELCKKSLKKETE